MRALCGAIIMAGALIGLGLASVAYGTRYQYPTRDADNNLIRIKWSETDRILLFGVVFTAAASVVGLGIAILGLAYHHERRNREWQYELERATRDRGEGQRVLSP